MEIKTGLFTPLVTRNDGYRGKRRVRRSTSNVLDAASKLAVVEKQRLLDNTEEKLREAGILRAAENVVKHERVELGDATAALDIGYKKDGTDYFHIVAIRIKAKSDNLPDGKNRVLSRAVRVCLNEADSSQIIEYSKEIQAFDEANGLRKRTVWERLDERWLPGNSLTDKINLAIGYATGMMEDDRSWISPVDKFVGKPGIGK